MKKFNRKFLNQMKKRKMKHGKSKGYKLESHEDFMLAWYHFQEECKEVFDELKKGWSKRDWNKILWELSDVHNMVELLYNYIMDNYPIPMKAK